MGDQGLTLAAQSLRDLVGIEPQAAGSTDAGRPTKAPRTASGGAAKSTLRHIETEQRRRDRINEGFQALKALMPTQEKLDKANFLMAAVDYIRQLQAVMMQLLAMGAISKLPEDLQWSVRVLLPRKDDPAIAAAKAAAHATAAPAAHLLPSLASQQPLVQQQGVQGQALDVMGMLQQALLVQQLQQQSQQGNLLQALQLQQQLAHLLPADLAGNPVADQAVSQAAQQVGGGLSSLSNSLVPAAVNNDAGNQPAITLQGTSGGCSEDPAGLQAGTGTKARKAAKVRRHTTAAKIAKPPSPEDELGQDGAGVEGRPLL